MPCSEEETIPCTSGVWNKFDDVTVRPDPMVRRRSASVSPVKMGKENKVSSFVSSEDLSGPT